MKSCFIFGAGDVPTSVFPREAGDLVIAADGGLAVLSRFGMEPDLLLGDFDSLAENDIALPEHVIRVPVEKDDTDMALAVRHGLHHGFRRFYLYGGTGGRMDHTMANWQLLLSLEKANADAYLIGGGYVATVMGAGSIRLPRRSEGILSAFAFGGDCSGVTEHAVQYCIDGAELFCDNAIGVSNHFIGEEPEISLGTGHLLLMWEGENLLPIARKRALPA